MTSVKTIEITFLIETMNNDDSVGYYIENLLSKYNNVLENQDLVIKLEHVYFYDSLSQISTDLYKYVGTSDIYSRKNVLSSVLKNIIYLVSTNDVNPDYSKYMELNLCKTRYFANIYGSYNLFHEIKITINDWISNLVGQKISLDNQNEIDLSSVLSKLDKCRYYFGIVDEKPVKKKQSQGKKLRSKSNYNYKVRQAKNLIPFSNNSLEPSVSTEVNDETNQYESHKEQNDSLKFNYNIIT